MWGVILRSGNHPRVGFENQNSLHENFLVGNAPRAQGLPLTSPDCTRAKPTYH